jgi:hypothetical protein
MTFARIRLVIAAALFLGWIGWLAYAVSQKGKAAVLSRAQLTAADLVVGDVTIGADGLPNTTVKVAQVIRGEGVQSGQTIDVLNLRAAMPPGANGFPGDGQYLLPLVGDGKTYRVAGLPRSPGYTPPQPERPVIYPWNGDTQTQLRELGLLP